MSGSLFQDCERINNHETTAHAHLIDEVPLEVTLSSGLASSKWKYQLGRGVEAIRGCYAELCVNSEFDGKNHQKMGGLSRAPKENILPTPKVA